MPFASINPTHPRTNLYDFVDNCSTFEFLFFKKNIFASFLFKLVTVHGVPRIFQNFVDYPDLQKNVWGYKIMKHTVLRKDYVHVFYHLVKAFENPLINIISSHNFL